MSPSEVDEHGQPLRRWYNAARLNDRAIDELIGLCRGILGDGAVTESEAELLMHWMAANRDAAHLWPASDLYRRLHAMLSDDLLDPDEQGELLDVLQALVGPGLPLVERAKSFAATLPLDIPPPEVRYQKRRFCLTGRFAFGTRKACESAIQSRGGLTQSDPTRDTSYLVIGLLGSSDWIHSSFGRKIESAVALRERGVPICIVSEEHWAESVRGS